jgi:hypothetical protein
MVGGALLRDGAEIKFQQLQSRMPADCPFSLRLRDRTIFQTHAAISNRGGRTKQLYQRIGHSPLNSTLCTIQFKAPRHGSIGHRRSNLRNATVIASCWNYQRVIASPHRSNVITCICSDEAASLGVRRYNRRSSNEIFSSFT